MIMVYGNMRKFFKGEDLLEEMKNSKNKDEDIKPTINTYINMM